MGLSNDLISQFTKVTYDSNKTKKESIVYGTIVYDGKTYVKLDGSDLLTPVTTTTDVKDGERVTVMIKNHTATVTGNISSPAARTESVTQLGNKVTSFDNVVAYELTTNDLYSVNASIAQLEAILARLNKVEAVQADIETLKAKYADLKRINADDITAIKASIEHLTATIGSFEDLSVEDITAANAEFEKLKSYVGDFTYIAGEKADIKYAQISFANIDKAWMEEFYARSGIIEYVTADDLTVTGTIVGVTIKGDLIEGNTIVADKLVIKGEDGLYYKLNTQGVTDSSYMDSYTKLDETIGALDGTLMEDVYTTTGEQVYSYVDSDENPTYYCVVDSVYYKVVMAANAIKVEQTDYNSLNGSIMTAKSITAEKISVSDLVAFDATIGGFAITSDSISTTIKDSDDNAVRGIYMDKTGQFNFGDSTNFVRYYKDEDGTYKLAIAAESILYMLNGTTHSISDVGMLTEYVKIGTYEGEPCIELGESDSDFKLIITNTRIMFMEGTNIPAYITNQSLHIEKAVIEDELQIGGFVWKKRANGNVGLMWKGAIE